MRAGTAAGEGRELSVLLSTFAHQTPPARVVREWIQIVLPRHCFLPCQGMDQAPHPSVIPSRGSPALLKAC